MKATIGLQNDIGFKKREAIIICASGVQHFIARSAFNNDGFILHLENVGDHDYETKMRNLKKFILNGDRVKVSLMFRGRENAHTELGFDIINRVIQDTVDITTVDQAPRHQGRFITAILVPKKATKK